MTPCCVFCNKEVFHDDELVFEKKGWFHELCWWKHECARLTAEVTAMKDASGRSTVRHAQHGVSSEPTLYDDKDE
jgi:hypothetical protein